MIPQRRQLQTPRGDAIDQAVFAINPARAEPGQRMLQWLGLAHAGVWVAGDFLQQLVNAPQLLAIGFLPVQVILPRSIREDKIHAPRSIVCG
jgi:hypothetical protein